MSESYCSYEVSKLLKKKGFDEPCRSYFIDNVDYIDTSYSSEALTDLNMGVWETLRPTHQMACAWLREEKYISIVITDDEIPLSYKYIIKKYNITELYKVEVLKLDSRPFIKYEDAVESAIKYCLENLI